MNSDVNGEGEDTQSVWHMQELYQNGAVGRESS